MFTFMSSALLLALSEDTAAVCKRVGRLRATKQKAEMLIASQQHSICDTDSDYSDAIAGRGTCRCDVNISRVVKRDVIASCK